MMKVIKLKDKIKTNLEEFKKVFENELGYIYKNTSSDFYEVFLKKTTPICIDFKNRVYSKTEVKERYPKNEDFGKWAWCVFDLDKAKEYIKEKN